MPTRTTSAAISLAALAIGTVQAQAQQSATTVTSASVTLQSVTVRLPISDRQFADDSAGDAGAEAINANCLTCHSAGMVLNQPALTRTAWQQEVQKMRTQFKAPVDDQAVPAIVDYLVAHKGPK